MNAVKRNQLKKILGRRSFAGLMDIYEQNFHLLNLLLPDIDNLPDKLISSVKGSPDLHLTILERCKYTTTLLLTYYFPDSEQEQIADPGLTIKIYHDARQAEAMACMKTGFMSVEHSHRNKKPYVDCRWTSNVFVEKWLRFSLQQGHTFKLERIKDRQPDTLNPSTECLDS